LDRTYIRQRFEPKLENPILVAGFRGVGNIGRIVARLMIESTQAKIFAELYSPLFPDYVLINRRGICRLPRYEFYVSTKGENLIILTGDGELPIEDVTAYYEISSDILDFVTQLGCRSIIIIDGAPSLQPLGEVFVASTSRKRFKELTKKGAIPFVRGSIIGVPGLLLGLAKRRKIEGVCILGSTLGMEADKETSFKVYEFLKKELEQYT